MLTVYDLFKMLQDKKTSVPHKLLALFPNTDEIVVDKNAMILNISPSDPEFNDSFMIVKGPFTHTAVNFCSQMIKDQCMDELFRRNHKQFLANFSAALMAHESSILWSSGVGVLFESVALSVLAKGGTYSYRVNGRNQVDQWTFESYAEKTFLDLKDIPIDTPGLYVPSSRNFTLVDAILILSDRKVFGIQVTVSTKHSFAHSGLQKLLDKFGKFGLIYVVPEKLFDAYPIVTGGEKKKDENQVEESLDDPSCSSKKGALKGSKKLKLGSKKLKLDQGILDEIGIYILRMPNHFNQKPKAE